MDRGEPQETTAMTNPETLRVMCPNLTCRKILAVPTSAHGKTVRCRSCQTNIRIPGPVGKENRNAATPSPGGTSGTAAA
jgi:hypothetical protein